MDAEKKNIRLKAKLEQKLELLKKNREAVSEEELQTKYKASYEALLKQIDDLTQAYFISFFEGFLTSKEKQERVKHEMEEILERGKVSCKSTYSTVEMELDILRYLRLLMLHRDILVGRALSWEESQSKDTKTA